MQNQDKLLECPKGPNGDLMCPPGTKCDKKSNKCTPYGCNNEHTLCLEPSKCNKITGNCEFPPVPVTPIPHPHTHPLGFGCVDVNNQSLCEEGTKCDTQQQKCVPYGCNKEHTLCLEPSKCNKITGNCDLPVTPIPHPHTHPLGFGCVGINNKSLCEEGTKCDPQHQKCVPDICTNQRSFDKAVYKALKHANKKEERKLERKMAIPLLIYMIIHLIFLVWAVMIAMKKPEENRVVHLTLAIVFSPFYVLANYLQ